MQDQRPTRPASRAATITDLFAALDDLMLAYQLLPETQRQDSCANDADRITGEISRHLAAARARLSPSFDPAPAITR